YSHSLSALLVLSSLYLALRPGPRAAPASLLLGLALGASVVVEDSNALRGALALPLAFLGLYDQLSFGCPWCVSTFQVDLERWPNAAGMPSAFATPLADGLGGTLWWGGNHQGLLL